MQLESSVLVDRPIAEVFAAWADLERASEWAAPVVERRKLSDGSVGVGSRFHAIDQFPGRRVEFDLEVTEFEPESRMAARWFEPMEGGWEATFSESDGATRLDLKAEMTPSRGIFKLLFPLMAGWVRRAIAKDLAAFKGFVESDP